MMEPVEGQAVEGPAVESSPVGLGMGHRLTAGERREREVQVFLRFLRAIFFVLVISVTLLNIGQIANDPTTGALRLELGTNWWIPTLVAVMLAVGVLSVDLLTPSKRISSFTGVLVGLLAGLVATYSFGFVLDVIADSWQLEELNPDYVEVVSTIKVLSGICLSYLGITFVLQTQDDFRLVVPYVEFAKQLRGQRPLVLDTSALIDGRLVNVVESGLVQAPLLVPRFVLDELQRLSDSDDKVKRGRGRRGLDLLGTLQRTARADVSIDETNIPGKAVDSMLVEYARLNSGLIVTTDAGLSRVAGIEGVGVVNLHDVAGAMRQSVVPGESIRVRLVKRGEQDGQGVGYLEDGTMVVGEGAEALIGEEVDLIVSTSLQTSAGRLIFAKPEDRVPMQREPEAEHVGEASTSTREVAGDAGVVDREQRATGLDSDTDTGSEDGAGLLRPGGVRDSEGGPRVVKRSGRNPRR